MKPTKNISRRFEILSVVCALLTAASCGYAQTNTWTGGAGDNNWGTAGNWSGGALTTGETPAFGAQGAGGLTLNNDTAAGTSYAGMNFNAGAPAFVLNGNQIGTTGGIFDSALSIETINLPILLLNASHSFNAPAGGKLVVNGVIDDAAAGFGITAGGNGSTGTVVLTTNNTYAGTTAVNAGTLVLDFNALTINSGGTNTNNILNPSSTLSLGGGTLEMNGSTTETNDQMFAGTTFTPGYSTVVAAPASGTVVISNNLNLGALSYTAGSSVMFVGPATSTSPTDADGTGQPGAVNGPSTNGFVPATANITTTSGAADTMLTSSSGGFTLLGGSSISGNAGFATVGLYDFAIVVGSSPFTIAAASQGTGDGGTGNAGSYLTQLTQEANGLSANLLDIVGTGVSTRNTCNVAGYRFNSPGAGQLNATVTESSDAVLVTPNVGAANVLINGAGTFDPGLRSGSVAGTMTLWQNNTGGLLIITAQFANGKTAGGGYVQAGPSTVVWNPSNLAGNAYTGPTWLNGGVSMIGGDSAFGAVATGALLTLNGGTVFAVKTFALDNAGANKRPTALGLAGGGLAANTAAQMTISGNITNAGTSAGPLWIGIPATTANSNILGLVPGTGNGTANPATNATGTVVLAGTNTYNGGTVLYSGTLNFNANSLGTGGITFGGGTLQWSTGTTLDVSSQTVTVGTAGGTLDLNGNNVTLANSIGNGGAGGLIVTNGTLTLDGANTYSGGTTIGTGATLNVAAASGSATGSGPVTVNSGATLEGIGSISGTVSVLSGGLVSPSASQLNVGGLSLNDGGVVDVTFGVGNSTIVTGGSGLTLNGGEFSFTSGGAPFTAPGTYNLVQFSGSIGGAGLDSTWTTASSGNPHVANAQVGTLYSFGVSDGFLTVTIAPDLSSVVATWSANANGNWSTTGNWTPARVPHAPGDSATLGVSSALRTVTLDTSESLGGLLMTNANSFVIAGSTTTLTIDNNGSPAAVTVTGGSANAIQPTVSLNSPTTVNVGAADKLNISGTVTNESTAEPISVTGGGTLELSGNNSYGPGAGAVGTTLAGGATLQVANNNALGAGDLSIAGNSTLQAGAAVALPNNVSIGSSVNATVDSDGTTIALNGAISGSGNLTKNGIGTLVLGSDNSGGFTGVTTINAGQVSITEDQNLGQGTAPVVLNGGDLAGTGSFAINRNVNIGLATGAAGANAMLDALGGASLVQINGNVASAGNTGADGLVVNGAGGAGTVELSGTGAFNGQTVVAGGVLDVANAAALSGSILNYNNQGGHLTFDGNSSVTAATFAGLSGAQSLALSNTTGGGVALTLSGSTSTAYSGNLTDGGLGGALTLGGTATLTLTGNSSLTGAVTVNSGELELQAGTLGCSTIGGGEFLVDGGTLDINSTNGTSTLGEGTAIFESAGAINCAFTIRGNVNDGTLIEVTGGTFSSATLQLQRTQSFTTAPTATAPIAASTTTGFYVDSTNTASPATVKLGNLNIGTENSSCSVRLDAGTIVVTNETLLGDESNTRWNVLQVNGGTFTDADTTNGITMSINNVTTPTANNSELYLSGGTTFAGVLNFGSQADTLGGEAIVIVTNASFYIGSGGVNLSNAQGLAATIYLETGILGATADWSSALTGDGASTGWLLGITGDDFNIQAADQNGVAHNITLSGTVGGLGNLVKTGGGTLTLSGLDDATGTTTVSAGTLALVGDGASTGIIQQSTDINVVSPGVLSAAGITNDTLDVGVQAASQATQTLSGNGTVSGNVDIGVFGTLAPGISTTNFGDLTVTSNVVVDGTVAMKVDHVGAIQNDELTAHTITVDTNSTLTVTQVSTNYLITGDTFKLFSVQSAGAFTTVNLPTQSADGLVPYTWTNKLAVNGTLVLLQGATGGSGPSTNRTTIVTTFSGSTLHISWPADHLGWTLQSNSVDVANAADWQAVAGSTSVTNEDIAVSTAQSNVFFRLVLPQ